MLQTQRFQVVYISFIPRKSIIHNARIIDKRKRAIKKGFQTEAFLRYKRLQFAHLDRIEYLRYFPTGNGVLLGML